MSTTDEDIVIGLTTDYVLTLGRIHKVSKKTLAQILKQIAEKLENNK